MHKTETMRPSIGAELRDEHCIQTKTGTPEKLRMYACDVHGPLAFASAALDLISGKPVEFVSCDRTPDGSGVPPVVKRIERFQVAPGARAVRWCGENGDPCGVGSSTLHGTGSIYDRGQYGAEDAAMISAALCWAMLPGARGGSWVFRTM